jgi:hypothetical protein
MGHGGAAFLTRLPHRSAPPRPALATLTYGANSLNQYPAAMSGYNPTIGQQITYDADGNMAAVTLAGDMNCDGHVNNFDTDAFMLALFEPEEYETEYPNCDLVQGDFTGNGVVDFGDIDPYLEVLFGGASAGLLTPLYTWDAENRLIRIEPNPAAAYPEYELQDGDQRIEFAYDYLGRRVRKTVETYDELLEDW